MLVSLVICAVSDPNYAESITAWSTLALAIITIFLVVVGYAQLPGINKASKADLILRYSSEFFSESNQNLILLCDNCALEYKTEKIEYNTNNITTDDFPYFEVNYSIIEQLPLDETKRKSIKKYYTCYEIDDFLGYFEDIGKFERQGLIAIDNVYNSFSWYISIAADNNAINQYLKTQKNRGHDFFENFKYISRKCKSLEIAISKDQTIQAWNIRWKLSNWILKR
ncbi:MAG: hypothetical protein ACHQHN_09195 [Sphingobacteriales bacterium]